MIHQVKKWKESHEEQFHYLLEQSTELTNQAQTAIKQGALKKLGYVFTLAQSLLQQLGVSTLQLDSCCQQALQAGALGAKLTGGGGGGMMFALCEEKTIEPVKQVLSAYSPQLITIRNQKQEHRTP
jgi:mevalonate kinase